MGGGFGWSCEKGKLKKMSLRFERRAGSLRLPSSSSGSGSSGGTGNNSGKNRKQIDQAIREDEYLKTWSYRQCQFACDYLNLMDPPKVRDRERAKLADVFGQQEGSKEVRVGSGSSARSSTISMSSRGSTSTLSSRASTMSSVSSGFSSIGNYYGELLDLGFELELEKVSFELVQAC